MLRDDVFCASKARHRMTMGILSSLLKNEEFEKAFEIAVEGFSLYMIDYYTAVLSDTQEGTQERFDVFRQHYEMAAASSNYCTIIESSPSTLKVIYNRCPFFEVMTAYHIEKLAFAFCLSDVHFTQTCLPGVRFDRTQTIVQGHECCDHVWIFQCKNNN